MKKIFALITGGTGQDGSYLADFLIKKGYKVVVADRRSSRADNWRHKYLKIEDKLIYEDFDLSYQLESKQNIFLYKEKLTIEKAKLWKGKIDVFISDYRRPVNENTILFKDNKIPLQKKIDKMMLEDVFINIDLIL